MKTINLIKKLNIKLNKYNYLKKSLKDIYFYINIILKIL